MSKGWLPAKGMRAWHGGAVKKKKEKWKPMAEHVQKKKLPRRGTLKGMMSVKCFDSSFSASFSSPLTQKISPTWIVSLNPTVTDLVHPASLKISRPPLFVDCYRLRLPAPALEPSGSDPAVPLFKQLDNVHIPNFDCWPFRKKSNFVKVDFSPLPSVALQKKLYQRTKP